MTSELSGREQSGDSIFHRFIVDLPKAPELRGEKGVEILFSNSKGATLTAL